MSKLFSSRALVIAVFAATVAACGTGAAPDDAAPRCSAAGKPLPGPGLLASDARAPELGDDVAVTTTSHISLADAVHEVEQNDGPVIEAKFELDDAGALSFSAYPAGNGIAMDAERNLFQEAAGDPTQSPLLCALEPFADREHLVRSARDLTLVQLSTKGVRDAALEVGGLVYWAVPTIQAGRAGYGVYRMAESDCASTYTFVDGGGSTDDNRLSPPDLGSGPGAGASDARVPELGDDVTVVRASNIAMADALAQVEAAAGPAIEAKLELGDDGALSLSIYPVADLALDPESTTFVELAGDPTAATFAPSTEAFADDDVEHLTRSSRDMTLVQTAGLSLRDAVSSAQAQIDGGVVFWAIPTMRDTRAGYGVYVLAPDDTVHYFFVD